MSHIVSLDPGLEAFVQRQVNAGRFASPTEVIQEALRLLKLSDEPQFDAVLSESIAQADRGDVIEADLVFAELAAEIEEIARSRAT